MRKLRIISIIINFIFVGYVDIHAMLKKPIITFKFPSSGVPAAKNSGISFGAQAHENNKPSPSNNGSRSAEVSGKPNNQLSKSSVAPENLQAGVFLNVKNPLSKPTAPAENLQAVLLNSLTFSDYLGVGNQALRKPSKNAQATSAAQNSLQFNNHSTSQVVVPQQKQQSNKAALPPGKVLPTRRMLDLTTIPESVITTTLTVGGNKRAPIEEYVIALQKKYTNIATFAPELFPAYALEFISSTPLQFDVYRSQDFVNKSYDWVDPSKSRNASLKNLNMGLQKLDKLFDPKSKQPFHIYDLNYQKRESMSEPMSAYVEALRDKYEYVPDEIIKTYVTIFLKNNASTFTTPEMLIEQWEAFELPSNEKGSSLPVDRDGNFQPGKMNDLQKIQLTMRAIEDINEKYSEYQSDIAIDSDNLPVQPFTPAEPLAEGLIPIVNQASGDINNICNALNINTTFEKLITPQSVFSNAKDMTAEIESINPIDIQNYYNKKFPASKGSTFSHGENAFIQINKDIAALEKVIKKYPVSTENSNLTALLGKAEKACEQMNTTIINARIEELMNKVTLVDASSLKSFQDQYTKDLSTIGVAIDGTTAKQASIKSGTIQSLVADQTKKIYIAVDQLLSIVKIIAKAVESKEKITSDILEREALFENPDSLVKSAKLSDLTLDKYRSAFTKVNTYIEKTNKPILNKILPDIIKDFPSGFEYLVERQYKINQKATALEGQKSKKMATESESMADTLWNNYQAQVIAAKKNKTNLSDIADPRKQVIDDLITQSKVAFTDNFDLGVLDTIEKNRIMTDKSTEIADFLTKERLDFLDPLQLDPLRKNLQVLIKLNEKKSAVENVALFAKDLLVELHKKSLSIHDILPKLEIMKNSSDLERLINEFKDQTGYTISPLIDIQVLIDTLKKIQEETASGKLSASAANVRTNLVQGNILDALYSLADVATLSPGAVADSAGYVSTSTRKTVIDFYGGDIKRADAFLVSVGAGLAAVLAAALPTLLSIANNQNLTDDQKRMLRSELVQSIAIDQSNIITAGLTGVDVDVIATGSAQDIATTGLFNKLINNLAPDIKGSANVPNFTGKPVAVNSFNDKYSSLLQSSSSMQSNSYTNYSSYTPQPSNSYGNYSSYPSSSPTYSSSSYTQPMYSSSTYTQSSYPSTNQTTVPSYNSSSTGGYSSSYATPSSSYTPPMTTQAVNHSPYASSYPSRANSSSMYSNPMSNASVNQYGAYFGG